MSKANTRMTKQRKEILKVLCATKTHPTADWIYDQVRKKIPNISLGTIYRNLNILVEMGKIRVLNYGSSYSRYDGVAENHYHFICDSCGKVFDIDVPVSKTIEKYITEKTPFQIFTHRTEFYGLCVECQEKN